MQIKKDMVPFGYTSVDCLSERSREIPEIPKSPKVDQNNSEDVPDNSKAKVTDIFPPVLFIVLPLKYLTIEIVLLQGTSLDLRV